MPINLKMKVDTKPLKKALYYNGNNWAKAVQYTVADMATRGPRIVAQHVSKVYNMPAARANPRNKKSSGRVALTGGAADMTFVYTGTPTPIKKFGMKPRGISKPRKRSYTITAKILREGEPTKLGHWSPPGTEGGRYGHESPRMLIPGVSAYGPVKRVGKGWKGGQFGPSVPQMVMNRGNDERERDELSKLLDKRLQHHLKRFGCQ